MASSEVTVAVKKRDDIRKANRMMFIWVALAAAIVGTCLVVAGFLLQKVIFKEQILAEKFGTYQTLRHNNDVADDLKKNVRALNVNEDLSSVMVDGQENPVRVVLDALPATANSSAFGSSLQKKILEADGVQIESLVVDPVQGSEASADALATTTETAAAGDNVISFTFNITSASDNPEALKEALRRIERSIRPISISRVTVEQQGARTSLQASGVTYFEPSQSVDVTKKTVAPKKGFLGL